jgi:hypothetical protein
MKSYWPKQVEGRKLALRGLVTCDVVHVYRCLDRPGVLNGVEELRRRGVAITRDDDDDVRLVPADSPGAKHVFSPMKVEQALRLQRAMLARADVGDDDHAGSGRESRRSGDRPMSYARSNIKVKEYAAAGVPWVASARGSYAGLGTKAGGMTVADDRWRETLLGLVGSRLKRMRVRRNAESWVKAQHISRYTGRWETALQMAVERADRRATQ